MSKTIQQTVNEFLTRVNVEIAKMPVEDEAEDMVEVGISSIEIRGEQRPSIVVNLPEYGMFTDIVYDNMLAVLEEFEQDGNHILLRTTTLDRELSLTWIYVFPVGEFG